MEIEFKYKLTVSYDLESCAISRTVRARFCCHRVTLKLVSLKFVRIFRTLYQSTHIFKQLLTPLSTSSINQPFFWEK